MAKKTGVIVRSAEWLAEQKRYQEAKKRTVAVGVLAEQGQTQVIIAAANEYGTADGHVPERSFIRSTVDSRRADIGTVQERAAKGVTSGKLTTDQGLGIIGQWVVGAIQKTISSSVPPPNAPSTIARKGSDGTLIDTGRLRQSIAYEVRKKT